MKTITLIFLLVILITVLYYAYDYAHGSEPTITESYHPNVGEYSTRTSPFFEPILEKEIHVFIAWVEVEEFKATSKAGVCPDLYYYDNIRGGCLSTWKHYHVVEVFLVQQKDMAEKCGNRHAQGCFIDWQIFIVNGKQGDIPNKGGCSVLWHELGHAKGKTHAWMDEHWPNSKCAVRR
jgi:hypothetical protein